MKKANTQTQAMLLGESLLTNIYGKHIQAWEIPSSLQFDHASRHAGQPHGKCACNLIYNKDLISVGQNIAGFAKVYQACKVQAQTYFGSELI